MMLTGHHFGRTAWSLDDPGAVERLDDVVLFERAGLFHGGVTSNRFVLRSWIADILTATLSSAGPTHGIAASAMENELSERD